MSADRPWGGKVQAVRRPEAFDGIRIGSVIRWNGRLRTVREIRRNLDGTIQVVAFAKLARSGYPSPLTLYWRSDIRTAFGGIVAHRKLPLCATELECALSEQIEADPPAWEYPKVTQRQTVGAIW